MGVDTACVRHIAVSHNPMLSAFAAGHGRKGGRPNYLNNAPALPRHREGRRYGRQAGGRLLPGGRGTYEGAYHIAGGTVDFQRALQYALRGTESVPVLVPRRFPAVDVWDQVARNLYGDSGTDGVPLRPRHRLTLNITGVQVKIRLTRIVMTVAVCGPRGATFHKQSWPPT